jgi:hypothetical protein
MTNYTLQSVANQLRAMNCDLYKIGIYDRNNNKMDYRPNLDYNNIINLIPKLKYENLNGKDIFIGQPDNIDRALILVDDLSSNKIQLTRQRGVSPACIVETSPGNFQVWISLGMEPMPKEQRKIVAVAMCDEFGGDPASTAANHFGRLAGFTNRKLKYLTGKGFPFILCRSSTGQHAEKSDKIRAWAKAKEMSTKDSNDKNRQLLFVSPSKSLTKIGPDLTFISYFDQWLKHIKAKNKDEDLSRGDFAVAARMLKEGYTKSEIIAALIAYSPDINSRKGNHI